MSGAMVLPILQTWEGRVLENVMQPRPYAYHWETSGDIGVVSDRLLVSSGPS